MRSHWFSFGLPWTISLMPDYENGAFFIEFFLGLPLEDSSTIESISINRYPTDTSQKTSDCGVSFLRRWCRNFFVLVRDFFTSCAGTKKFTRHVFPDSKHKNSGAQTDWPRDDACYTFRRIDFSVIIVSASSRSTYSPIARAMPGSINSSNGISSRGDREIQRSVFWYSGDCLYNCGVLSFGRSAYTG